ncbi:hypothetical protein GcM1_175010 [Golovinomyces cichoracearum]|uniref:Uncharacterized protein n=1 Tax=Golovinomyces cichoracearum TaxID=62708 RepID=A0A420J5L6_9PEZI|nr:hypothetical protein GcM1_175010 [Golovinomyces cichoracearum]
MIARSLLNACSRESNRGRWINLFRELQLYDGNAIKGPDPRAMWRIEVPDEQGTLPFSSPEYPRVINDASNTSLLPGRKLYLLVIHWDKKFSECHYLGALMHRNNKYIPCINNYSEYVATKSDNTA